MSINVKEFKEDFITELELVFKKTYYEIVLDVMEKISDDEIECFLNRTKDVYHVKNNKYDDNLIWILYELYKIADKNEKPYIEEIINDLVEKHIWEWLDMSCYEDEE